VIRLPLLALLLVSALWGSHPVVGKLVEHQLSPLPLTVWRFTLGAALYLPIFKKLPAIMRLPRRQFWLLALSGLMWAVLYPLFYYQSLRILSPIESLLLVNTSPLIAAL
jgi:drug/metabolite transporter (DMT)-like permease